ncbi:MAG: CCA tRNA nucleotidyltransferase [Nitratiruptor sp.]|nr:CCA tRNA nucleotidyltransferase [Nitratiruptor sp.]NPA83873.1 CCA tRNA nucleotidyltransferase [Campylobacterota bacterium]
MPHNFEHEGRYPWLLEELPQHLREDLAHIRQLLAPYTRRAYLVGGAVRDLVRTHLEGHPIPIIDLDIEVYGIEPDRFEALMESLGAKGVGKSFFVYKYKEYIDLSLPRLESKVGRGHRGFVVELASSEREASLRRDFRMNALMLDIFTGKLLDFWGGVEDIAKRRIAIIDPEKFREDSLRVLRGVQFSARFGYKIEERSVGVMASISLEDLSHERIFWEFEKLFQGRWLHYGAYYLTRLGVDRQLFSITIPFCQVARELLRFQRDFLPHLRKFSFLYILANKSHKSYRHFLDRLKAPREYYRTFRLQKGLPKSVTDRFIAAMALRFPLRDYLGNYDPRIAQRAKELGLWERPFQAVTPKELLAQGFHGARLGAELRRRNLAAIRERFKGRE